LFVAIGSGGNGVSGTNRRCPNMSGVVKGVAEKEDPKVEVVMDR
jgi:hypothetical protein